MQRMFKWFRKERIRGRKGQTIVEYGILVGAASLATIVATTMLGHKSGYLYAVMSGLLPSIHTVDQSRVSIGKLVSTDRDGDIAVVARTGSADLPSFESQFGLVATDFAEDDLSDLAVNGGAN
ncbi:MAG: hypothetical protein MI861_18760 [Pirellulales bacterium]|nr:hypothetical protein [Pirellulales bacterium]